jgi:hypothetical protein
LSGYRRCAEFIKESAAAIGTQPKTEEEKRGLEALQSMTQIIKLRFFR